MNKAEILQDSLKNYEDELAKQPKTVVKENDEYRAIDYSLKPTETERGFRDFREKMAELTLARNKVIQLAHAFIFENRNEAIDKLELAQALKDLRQIED